MVSFGLPLPKPVNGYYSFAFVGVAFALLYLFFINKSVLPRTDIRIRIRGGVIRIRIRKPGIRAVIRITAEIHALRTNSRYILTPNNTGFRWLS